MFIKDSEIDEELIYRFRDYNKDYIKRIINNLRYKNILISGHSCSGWKFLVCRHTVNLINNIISNQTHLNMLKLRFIRYIEINNIDYDISRLICDKVDLQVSPVHDGTLMMELSSAQNRLSQEQGAEQKRLSQEFGAAQKRLSQEFGVR